MNILITAGPTREAIDPVRYIGNRSSGQMGAALAAAALDARHRVTVIAGPITASMLRGIARIDVESAAQMHEAVLHQFPQHDLLIMAAAVADYRPMRVHTEKLARGGTLVIECEPTEDILAAAGKIRRSHQRIIGFSLENRGDLARAREKLIRKNLDLMVYNPVGTMESGTVDAVLLWPDGREEQLEPVSKIQFARILMERAAQL